MTHSHAQQQFPAACLLEPAFSHGQGTITLPFGENDTLLNHLSFLDRKLLNAPNDLRIHVARAKICMALHQHDRLFAALIDLFTITGPMLAGPLKQRLLSEASGYLSRKQRRILHRALARGLSAATVWRHAPLALLKPNMPGNYQFIKRVEEEPESNLLSPSHTTQARATTADVTDD